MTSRFIKIGFILLIIAGIFVLEACSSNRQIVQTTTTQEVKNPDLATQRVIDGSLFDMREDRARAILEYEEALRFDNAAGIHYALTKDYTALGKNYMAILHGKEAVRLDSTNPIYHQTLADAYLSAHDIDHALKEYEEVAHFDSTSIAALFTIGRIHQQKQEYPQALQTYRKIRDQFGPSWQTLYQAAAVYETMKQFDSAATMYQEMLQLDPSNIDLKKRLAATYLRAEKTDTAISILNDLHQIDSTDIEINITRGNVFLEQKKIDEAYKTFSDVFSRDSVALDAELGIAVEFLHQTSDTAQSLEYAYLLCRQIQQRYPQSWQIHVLLGDIEAMHHNDSSAIEQYEKAIGLNRSFPQPYVQLGILYLQRNNYTKAIAILENGRTEFPDEYSINYFLGFAYTQSQKNEQAIPLLQHALNIEPKSIDAMTLLAQTLDGMKRFTESDSLYEQALKIEPKNHLVLNNFSYSLAERKIRLQEALTMATTAIEKDSANSAYLDTVGWIYFRLNQLDKALFFINRAVSLRQQSGGSDAVLLEHLGDVYSALGNKDKAIEYWKEALHQNSSNKDLQEKIDGAK